MYPRSFTTSTRMDSNLKYENCGSISEETKQRIADVALSRPNLPFTQLLFKAKSLVENRIVESISIEWIRH